MIKPHLMHTSSDIPTLLDSDQKIPLTCHVICVGGMRGFRLFPRVNRMMS